MEVELFTENRQLVLKVIDDCLAVVVRMTSRHFSGRMGLVKVSLATALLSLVVSFPHYRVFNQRLDDDPTIKALIVKFHNPLSPIPPALKDWGLYDGYGSHNDKLELRLTLPILGWLSGTGKWTVVIWSSLSAFFVFYLLARLGSEALDDEVGGALFALALGATFFGSWFFHDIDFGDGIAFLLLLFSIASGNLVFASVSFLAAAFADERCVAAIPLLLLYFAVSRGADEQKKCRRRHYIAILSGAAIWWLLRTWIARSYNLTMGTSGIGSLPEIFFSANFPYAFLDIFKASWTIPLVAAICLYSKRRWIAALVYFGAFGLAFAPALLVDDFDRSACYTFTFLLTSLYFLRGDRESVRKYLAAILVVNVLLISPARSILRIAAWPKFLH